jgi:hypothetical protein
LTRGIGPALNLVKNRQNFSIFAIGWLYASFRSVGGHFPSRAAKKSQWARMKKFYKNDHISELSLKQTNPDIATFN